MKMNDASRIFLAKYKSDVKNLGLKSTYHRDLVVQTLFDFTGYAEAIEIKKKIKEECRVEMKLSLVVKILHFLGKIGVVSVILIAEKKSIRYKLLHHTKSGCLVCKKCARAEEFEDRELVSMVHEVAKKCGFEVDRNRTFVLNVR